MTATTTAAPKTKKPVSRTKKNKLANPAAYMPHLEVMLEGLSIAPDEENDRQELARIANWIRLYGVPVERYRRDDGVICYKLAAATIREYLTSEESRTALMTRQRAIMAQSTKARRARAARDLFADLGLLEQLPDVVRLLAETEAESDPIDTDNEPTNVVSLPAKKPEPAPLRAVTVGGPALSDAAMQKKRASVANVAKFIASQGSTLAGKFAELDDPRTDAIADDVDQLVELAEKIRTRLDAVNAENLEPSTNIGG